jgi:uncharacterized alkaline shock family protein YloU
MKVDAEKVDKKEQVVNANSCVQGLGDVKIHENVVSSIVRKAVLKHAGVSRLSGNNFVDTIGEIVGSRRIQDRAIIVKFLEDGSLDLEVKVIVKYGFNLPDVASETQKNIIEEVEKITGINVFKVNVTIQDVEEEYFEDEDSDDVTLE